MKKEKEEEEVEAVIEEEDMVVIEAEVGPEDSNKVEDQGMEEEEPSVQTYKTKKLSKKHLD